ncbi:MAG: DUF3078 domain-containing protein [Cyclobacteriaceae bacterium]|nr:DUF3078 domain-containing protein [Cyclobacteriaceae bacterium]
MIKQLQLFIVASSICTAAFAQTTPQDTTTVPADTVWKINGAVGFKFNQVALTNWVAGGQNSLALNTTFDIALNYAKDKWKWDNLVHLGYGISKQGEDPLNKTDDQILINTNLGYELKGPWYATFNANFRTQFVNGYDLPNDSVVISTFMAPGYLVAGLGIEYKPNDNFVFLINPIANKTTFVMDDLLAAQGAYGVDSSANIRAEFGAFLSLFYKKEIVKNVTFTTLYTMFGNYEDLAVWDINWDLILDFKINSFMEANLTTNLIYDQDIAIPVDRTGDGIKESVGPRVQFRQALGIGLTAKF